MTISARAAADAAEVAQALERENAQLREALSSRIVIEQAKGILAERYRLAVSDAFEAFRSAARSNRIRLHALAARVAPDAPTPPEIEDLVNRGTSTALSADRAGLEV